jgi:periplasmic protein TonB
MGHRLFEDLVLSATDGSRTASLRAFPLSLGVHALAVAALLLLSMNAVREEARPGPLVFRPEPQPAGGPPRGIARAGGAPPRLRGIRKPLSLADPRPAVVSDVPAPIHETEPSVGTSDDSPVCLSGCAPGDSGGGGQTESAGNGVGEPGGGGEGSGLTLPVGGNIREPRRIRGSAPVYPELARRARVQGKVVLECVIDTDGRVTDLRVVSGNPLLAESASDAVRRWVYSPTTLNGQPIRVILNVTVTFALG